MWNLCQNALPTKDNLFQRKIIPNPICSLCNQGVETVEHLLLLCPWTKELWKHPKLQIHISPKNLTRIEIWFGDIRKNSNLLPDLEMVAVILWHIWKSRNHAIFGSKQLDPSNLVDIALAELQSFKRWNPKLSKSEGEAISSSKAWIPPKKGTFKINIDGSYEPGRMEGSVACICRDFTGNLLDGAAQTVTASSAFMAEAQALFEALNQFLSLRKEEVVFEIDSSDLVKH
ncbi:hypothetical protein ACJRO7_004112 [Eucalyptus globulus]|uniref:RNase H type-1 domain-containing protein n=1 Tax=Eucalyptus globulus TaxID=34317 RepID=A0ABD3IYF8_EUCGL